MTDIALGTLIRGILIICVALLIFEYIRVKHDK
jgi:hypothetical protein